MKRNKRTTVLAHEDLAPLTEQILAKMGKVRNILGKQNYSLLNSMNFLSISCLSSSPTSWNTSNNSS